MKLVLATNNKDKIREMKNLLDDLGIEILTSSDFDDFPDIEETGDSLKANAILKAEGIFKVTGLPSLADDTGLEVDYLNGAPGIYSARFAGVNCTYDDNNSKLLSEMKNVPYGKRTAQFRTVIAICRGEHETTTVEGSVDGYIAQEKSESTKGFGYDPIFFHPPSGKTFAEMTLIEKNKISHRGLALKKAREFLKRIRIKKK